MWLPDDLKRLLTAQERKKFFSLLQAQAEAEGSISLQPQLYSRRMGDYLEYGGGIVVGVFLGVITLLLNFLLFVWLLHLEL